MTSVEEGIKEEEGFVFASDYAWVTCGVHWSAEKEAEKEEADKVEPSLLEAAKSDSEDKAQEKSIDDMGARDKASAYRAMWKKRAAVKTCAKRKIEFRLPWPENESYLPQETEFRLLQSVWAECSACRRAEESRTGGLRPLDQALAEFEILKRNEYASSDAEEIAKSFRQEEDDDDYKCGCTKDAPCNDKASCPHRAAMIECTNNSCNLGKSCQNRQLQRMSSRPSSNDILKSSIDGLELKEAGAKGFGIYAKREFKAGDFFGEYLGQIYTQAEFQEIKQTRRKLEKHTYCMRLGHGGLLVDASRKGGKVRFLNHSCTPNSEAELWTVAGERRVAIVASKDIHTGDELTFDYAYGDQSLASLEFKHCLCGTPNCRQPPKHQEEDIHSNAHHLKQNERTTRARRRSTRNAPQISADFALPDSDTAEEEALAIALATSLTEDAPRPENDVNVCLPFIQKKTPRPTPPLSGDTNIFSDDSVSQDQEDKSSDDEYIKKRGRKSKRKETKTTTNTTKKKQKSQAKPLDDHDDEKDSDDDQPLLPPKRKKKVDLKPAPRKVLKTRRPTRRSRRKNSFLVDSDSDGRDEEEAEEENTKPADTTIDEDKSPKRATALKNKALIPKKRRLEDSDDDELEEKDDASLEKGGPKKTMPIPPPPELMPESSSQQPVPPLEPAGIGRPRLSNTPLPQPPSKSPQVIPLVSKPANTSIRAIPLREKYLSLAKKAVEPVPAQQGRDLPAFPRRPTDPRKRKPHRSPAVESNGISSLLVSTAESLESQGLRQQKQQERNAREQSSSTSNGLASSSSHDHVDYSKHDSSNVKDDGYEHSEVMPASVQFEEDKIKKSITEAAKSGRIATMHSQDDHARNGAFKEPHTNLDTQVPPERDDYTLSTSKFYSRPVPQHAHEKYPTKNEHSHSEPLTSSTEQSYRRNICPGNDERPAINGKDLASLKASESSRTQDKSTSRDRNWPLPALREMSGATHTRHPDKVQRPDPEGTIPPPRRSYCDPRDNGRRPHPSHQSYPEHDRKQNISINKSQTFNSHQGPVSNGERQPAAYLHRHRDHAGEIDDRRIEKRKYRDQDLPESKRRRDSIQSDTSIPFADNRHYNDASTCAFDKSRNGTRSRRPDERRDRPKSSLPAQFFSFNRENEKHRPRYSHSSRHHRR